MDTRGTLLLGHIGAIPVRLHASLLGVLPVLALLVLTGAGHTLRLDMPRGLFSALMLIALFGAVVLHELGHALAARGCGARVTGIVLTLTGGVTHIERREAPWQEALWIAAAGPLANLTVGTVSVAIGERVGPVDWYTGLVLFGRFNLLLVLINLMPIRPLDGHHMLRALRRARRPDR